VTNPLWPPGSLEAVDFPSSSFSAGDEIVVGHPAEVISQVPSMAVTGLMHGRNSHLGHHSCSGKTQAYP
jgi:hypothetical protein